MFIAENIMTHLTTVQHPAFCQQLIIADKRQKRHTIIIITIIIVIVIIIIIIIYYYAEAALKHKIHTVRNNKNQ